MNIAMTTTLWFVVLLLLASVSDARRRERNHKGKHDEGKHDEGKHDEGKHDEGKHDEGKHDKCKCPPGWTCRKNKDDCASNPCKNNGTCVDGVKSFTCTCPPGFTGPTCNKDIDECASNPCLNGGICVDGVNGFTCNCTAPFNGTNCSEGCFHKWGRVRLSDGRQVVLENLRVGDEVLATDQDHRPVFSKVLYFLYRNTDVEALFLQLWTEGRAAPLLLTSSHLLFVYDVTADQWRSTLAADVTPGMQVGVFSPENGTLTPHVVREVGMKRMTSAYAPLTAHGTIVVDDVMASCYAKHSDHDEAHLALTWARGLYWLGAGLGLTNEETGQEMKGRHWSVELTQSLVCQLTSQPWC